MAEAAQKIFLPLDEPAKQAKPPEERPMLAPGVPMPPTADELPYDDGEPLESNRHQLTGTLLRECLDREWAKASPERNYFIAVNMALHYNVLVARERRFRAPDFFVVLGTQHRDRKSWVVWEEDTSPDVVIEVISDTTEAMDRGEKMRVYGTVLRIPEYYLFDPLTGALEGYALDLHTIRYQPMRPDEKGRLRSERLQLLLGLGECTYRGFGGLWLRWFNLDGAPLPTDEEAALAERLAREAAEQKQQEAEQRQQEAEQRQQEAERARDELRARLARYEQRFGALPTE